MNETSIAGGEKKKACQCGFMLAIFLVVAATAAAILLWLALK
jgi:hypothetical protein